MGTRHSLERRQQFAEMATTMGDAVVAAMANVRGSTVRKWRQQFGVLLQESAAVASVSHLNLHDMVPAEDTGHPLVVATRSLNEYEPTDEDPKGWRENRSEFLRHFAAYIKPDTHPGIQRFHARRMSLAAEEMWREARDEMEAVCESVSVEADAEFQAAVYAADSAEDDDLPDPAEYPQRADASYDDFGDHGEYPNEIAELRAMAEIVAQDVVAEPEDDAWRQVRDEFLGYLEAYDDPDAHPAVAKHYIWRLYLCACAMDEGSAPTSKGSCFYAHMARIAHSEVEAASYALDSMV